MGVLEVTQPALKDGIELADNGLQATRYGCGRSFGGSYPEAPSDHAWILASTCGWRIRNYYLKSTL